ncbi:hypothetical protein EC957_008300 [Mortierella hygrophila]|uniref:Uncharacterized protein n=1 Tax=Mortierella hygrophila TaxID=979708 RepID=A0A9P6EWA4_9FUNG|nr:hypothetical protein EC957_008300 [Mortierella hygrophila]
MSYPPVFDYLFSTANPKPYLIFRAFIIAHDSQDLQRFRLWVDRLLDDHVPLLDKPAFTKNRIISALTVTKTAPLIVNHLAIPDELRTARTLPSPSPPGPLHQQEHQKEQQMVWIPQAHQGQPLAQMLPQASQIAGPGLSSTYAWIQGAERGRGRGFAPVRGGVRGGHGRGRGGPQT